MRSSIFIAVAFLAALCHLYASDELDIRYQLDLTFIPESPERVAVVEGTNRITVINHWDQPLRELHLHNNSNGYTDPSDNASHRTIIGDIQGEGLGELTGADEISMRLELDPALAPGDSLLVEIPFTTRLSPHGNPFAPTVGTVEDTTIYSLIFFYPVLEYFYADGWRVERHGGISDPYSNLAEYRVSLTYPQGYEVGTSAHLVRSDTLASGMVRQTLTYPRCISFSAVLSRTFLRQETRVRDIAVELLYTPGQEAKAEKLLKDMAELVPFYEEQFGPCQNDKLTITMCYSLSEAAGAIATSNIIIGQGEMSGTSTLAHEFGHQWFGNAINADENFEAWLNESFSEYAARMFLLKRQRITAESAPTPGAKTFDLWSDLRTFQPEHLFWLLHDILGDRGLPPIHQKGVALEWENLDDMVALLADAVVVYYEGANALQMLQSAVGDSLMQAILLEYNRDYTWRTVTTDTFVVVVGQLAGERIAEHFQRAITTSQRPDLKITGVDTRQVADDQWETGVKTDYEGAWLLPIDVQAVTAAGDTVTESRRWLDEEQVFRFVTTSPVTRVRLDPRGKMFDYQRGNNHWPRRIQIQPLYGLPSWDTYKLYVRPRIKVDWRGDWRYGVRLAGVLGGNFMPWAPSYFSHRFRLDVTYSPELADHNWGGQVIYRNPVRGHPQVEWEMMAGYEYPRNQQSITLRTYLGKPQYYFHGGQAAYQLLTTRLGRMEYPVGGDDGWNEGRELILDLGFIRFNHTVSRLSIFKISSLTGYTGAREDDQFFHRFSTRIDQARRFLKVANIRVWADGRFVWDTRPNDAGRYRLGHLPQIWNEQGGASYFRGRTDVDSEWWDAMVTGGVSLGWWPKLRIDNHPVIYMDWAIVDRGNSPLVNRLKDLFDSKPIYTALGLGWESRSILQYGLYFPIWLSHPPNDEPNWKFRVMVQLELNY
jgi:hypothetical protein